MDIEENKIQQKLEKAIDKVFNKLSNMSKEEFDNELKNHKSTWIKDVVMESLKKEDDEELNKEANKVFNKMLNSQQDATATGIDGETINNVLDKMIYNQPDKENKKLYKYKIGFSGHTGYSYFYLYHKKKFNQKELLKIFVKASQEFFNKEKSFFKETKEEDVRIRSFNISWFFYEYEHNIKKNLINNFGFIRKEEEPIETELDFYEDAWIGYDEDSIEENNELELELNKLYLEDIK